MLSISLYYTCIVSASQLSLESSRFHNQSVEHESELKEPSEEREREEEVASLEKIHRQLNALRAERLEHL